MIDVSIWGVLALANAENIIQARTITAPSKHTPTYDFINALPICDVPSPANDESGTGASAVYIYNLKNRPYTLIIIINDSTVINRLPSIVTSHNGMLAQKPASSTAVSIAAGSVTAAPPIPPRLPAIFSTTPPHILYITVIRSSAYVIATFAARKRIKCFNAYSGR